jgi:hypothetical protein
MTRATSVKVPVPGPAGTLAGLADLGPSKDPRTRPGAQDGDAGPQDLGTGQEPRQVPCGVRRRSKPEVAVK